MTKISSYVVTEKAEIDPSIRETSPKLTTKTTPDEPGNTNIKTSDEESKSSIGQAFPTFEQDVSNISLDVSGRFSLCFFNRVC